MQKFILSLKIILGFIYFVLLVYVSLPNIPFPYQPLDSVQSLEDADTETTTRRAFFTDLTREQIMEYYSQQLKSYTILGISFPTYTVNYPPEEAYTIIRDQTRSTFLEQAVHPFRESIFVNGFKPKEEKDAIWYKGRPYDQKITVRYVTSPLWIRITVLTASFAFLFILVDMFLHSFISLFKEWVKR